MYIYMSDIDEYFDKNDAVMKKLVSCHKQLKIILDSIKSIEFKVDAGLNFNMAMNKIDGKDNAEEKEKMDKIFEKRGLGRPIADFETKRKTYYDMVVSGKIKMPRDTILQYYNIHRCVDGKYVLADKNEDNETV